MNYIKYLDDNRKIVYATKDSVEERLLKLTNVTIKDIVDCWMIYNNAQEVKEEDWLHLP